MVSITRIQNKVVETTEKAQPGNIAVNFGWSLEETEKGQRAKGFLGLDAPLQSPLPLGFLFLPASLFFPSLITRLGMAPRKAENKS